ncbi:MAG: pantoate--beta-alanine ligase, partial [Bacteroidia bacterium]|nr:pantoate--beta-alanine ligase [Bacteroidia bacterium]MBP7245263.1 pantoate--beta-alanine ligase [Bacteroidia bacterium]
MPFATVIDLQAALNKDRIDGKKIGFVPTMGALHAGHLSLIARAAEENDVVVCSIFVNPTQFNNASDLEKYPRMPDADIHLLKQAGCDYAFLPSVDEIYPNGKQLLDIDFGALEKVMEGEFRPGHFKGMATVVNRLFEIVNPEKAYFG